MRSKYGSSSTVRTLVCVCTCMRLLFSFFSVTCVCALRHTCALTAVATSKRISFAFGAHKFPGDFRPFVRQTGWRRHTNVLSSCAQYESDEISTSAKWEKVRVKRATRATRFHRIDCNFRCRRLSIDEIEISERTHFGSRARIFQCAMHSHFCRQSNELQKSKTEIEELWSEIASRACECTKWKVFIDFTHECDTFHMCQIEEDDSFHSTERKLYFSYFFLFDKNRFRFALPSSTVCVSHAVQLATISERNSTRISGISFCDKKTIVFWRRRGTFRD